MSSTSRRRLRLVTATLGLLVCFALARPARAQLGTAGTIGTTTTASLADGDVFVGVQATEGANLTDFDLLRFFNQANCNCDTPVFLFFTLTSSGLSKRSAVPTGTLYFLVGSSCNDPILMKTQCQLIGNVPIATFMALGNATIQTSARVLSANSTVGVDADGGVLVTSGTTPNATCTSPTNGFNQTIWAVFDYGADGTFEFSATQAVFVDLTPPPVPDNIKVTPGNEAVNISWTPVDETLNQDLQGYQIFCQRGDLQVFPKGTFTPQVRSCSTTMGTGVDGLDPLFVCSPLLNRSVDSFRVKILQNGIPYGAVVVSIDNSGNALPPDLAHEGQFFTTPVKTDSFFDVYRDGNQTNGGAGMPGATPGAATGGFCAVAGPESRPSRWVLGAGLGALGALAFAGARRRRR